MPIQVPESYRTYCADRAVQTAVEHILNQRLRVPADLEWNHLPDFHRAVLSAHQVRCEFAIFLHELWNAAWQPAVNGRGFTSKTVADSQKWVGKDNLDTYSIWTDGGFAHAYNIASTSYEFSIGTFAGIERVQLSLYLWDGENAPTSELGLDECWPNIDDDYIAWSSKELAPIVDGGIEVDRLAKAAEQALTAIEQFCQPD